MEKVQTHADTEFNYDITQSSIYDFLEKEHDVRLTSSELANLWASWMESSLKKYMALYFMKTAEDPDVMGALEYTLSVAQKHLQIITEIYAREKHPIPRGLIEEDINIDAPGLFSDSFILKILEDMAKSRLDGYSTALQMTSRTDIRKYFTECVADASEVYNKAVSVMLSKGIYMRAPYIPVPERVSFVKKKSYITGFPRKTKPLNSIEISHIFSGLQNNSFRKALFTGYNQVASSEKVRQYMKRGSEISAKHIEIFSSLLVKNDLPVSMSWDSGITDSKIAPFTEKLMMEMVRSSNVVLAASYGKAITVVEMKVGIDFARLTTEVLKFLSDGIALMIDNGWLEEPPVSGVNNSQANNLH